MPKQTKPTPIKLQTLDKLGPLKFISTGISELDTLVQGFPIGRVSEIYAPPAVGKTYLVSKAIAAISKDSKVLYVDVENALSVERMKSMGGKPENISISTEYMLEDVADLVIDSVGKFDLIVIDSIAALVPKVELEGETGAAVIGVKAKLMGQWMRKIIAKLGKSNTALVFINQLRSSPSLYAPTFTPGGVAIPYASSLRIQLSTAKADRKDNSHIVHAEVTKCKYDSPYRKTSFELEY